MRNRFYVIFFLLISSCVIAATPHGAEAAAGKKPVKAVSKRVVFDLSHEEVFTPTEAGPLNYSVFYNTFKEQGWKVGITKERISANTLKGVRTYVIAGPMKTVDDAEIEALHAFVKKGGRLIVMLHISAPAAQLCESFGILVSNFVIAEPQDNIAGAAQDFYVTRFAKHPVTDGVSRAAVYGSWGLMSGDPDAKIIAATSERAWADTNRNRSQDAGEPVQEFGIIGVSEVGKGKVVIVADDAPFANKFINTADNGRMAENIIGWFAK